MSMIVPAIRNKEPPQNILQVATAMSNMLIQGITLGQGQKAPPTNPIETFQSIAGLVRTLSPQPSGQPSGFLDQLIEDPQKLAVMERMGFFTKGSAVADPAITIQLEQIKQQNNLLVSLSTFHSALLLG